MKVFNVTVRKGDETESMKIDATNETEAQRLVLDGFYYDGWHAISTEEL